jgi:hypothetical protein
MADGTLKVGTITTSSGSGTITIPDAVNVSSVSLSNTPAFQAYRTALQSISNSTFTKVQNNVVLFDTDSAYDNSTNYRFTIPSGKAGKYVFGVQCNIHDLPDAGYAYALIYKNGSKLKENIVSASRTIPTSATTITIDDASVGDYYEAYTKQVSGGSLDLNYAYGNVFYGYRIIGA